MMKKKVNLALIILCILSFFRVVFVCFDSENSYFEEEVKLKGKIIDIQKEEDKVVFVLKSDVKYKITSYKEFYYELGDFVLVNAKVYSASDNTVFNLFNYRKYLLSQNIIALGELKNIKLLKKNNNIFYGLKNVMIKHIESYKSENYLKTFVLADQSKIEDDVKEGYRNLGISHVFSVSGMHVGLFILVINKVLKRFKYKDIFIFGFLACYLFLTGFPPSLLRCILFLILNYFNKKLRLNYKGEYILIIVAFLLLLFNPYLIYNVGFLFSVTITFYILLISKNIKGDSYTIKNFKISLIAFLASVPILAFSFFKVNLISVLYNMVFVPIVSFFIFPFSLLTFAIPLFDKVYFILINLFETSSLFLGNLRLFNITISKPHFIVALFYYLLLFLAIKFDKRIIIVYIIVFLLNINSRFFIMNSKITFLDVGQGDSLIMIFPKGKCVLIDTGGDFNYSISKNKIIPYLNSIGINKIDMLVLTHGDYDHMGEAINLVENFKVEKVIFNCGEFNELENELINVLDKKKTPYYSCIKELNLDNNKLYFINDKLYDNENDNSSVIYTKLNNYKFLFMGDAGVEVEEDLIGKYNLRDIDVLKVGHHGSKTSSGKEFINEVNPKYSIISVGKNNRYGHPNDIVLDNLVNSKIYRTDQDGSIMFKIKKNKLEIETCAS